MPQFFPEVNPTTGEFVSPMVRDRYAPRDWDTLTKPAVVAAGATAAAARSVLGLGTAALAAATAFAPAGYTPPITGLPAGATDTTKVLRPDGAGGVTWGNAPTGGGTGTTFTEDPAMPGFYAVTAGGTDFTEDPNIPGLYIQGA